MAGEAYEGELFVRFLSGFESTHIFGTKKDVLELTKHT